MRLPVRSALLATLLLGCGGEGGGGTPVDAPDIDAPGPQAICEALGLPVRPFADGPYGTQRGDVADDFTLPLRDGTMWNLRERRSGCDSIVFVPDTIRNSGADGTTVWARDVDRLIAASPRNVHYFFVSRKAQIEASLTTIESGITAALAALPPADAAHWAERLHVVARQAYDLDNWIDTALGGTGAGGFAIDRAQRVRGVGMLADVTRYDSSIPGWPWESNLAYAAHEAIYFNGEAERQAVLDADDATVVPLWTGEVLPDGFAEVDVTLPPAATLATFDTLVVEVTQQCPDPVAVELNNCGAWDYLAHLRILDEDGATWRELARFITSYHRESHWTVDASPMLAQLGDGGTRRFRWEWAPEWNTQPTATRISLRFSNRGKGHRPAQAVPLFTGGPFNSTYNATRQPIDVPIPAGATRVELYTLVTGHGADSNQCAEFCNHQHEITVGGRTYRQEFAVAGTESGCIAEVARGMTPNQGGTWWYGRGGWCPGQQVTPWVVDITGDVTPGQTATLSYRGLFNDTTPPDAGDANIVLTTYLVVSQ